MTKQTDKQKEARARYNERHPNKYKNVTITLPTEEETRHRAIMQEHGVTPIQVWRKGIDTVSKEPTDKGE